MSKTPNKSKKRVKLHQEQSLSSDVDNDLAQQFSPIVSPCREQRQGNLTGNARKIKDSAADWHNHVQKWNQLNVTSTEIVNKIANAKLEYIYKEDTQEDGSLETAPQAGMPAEIEILCTTLEKIIEKMGKIISKMRGLTAVLKGVWELDEHQSIDSDSKIYFLTWLTKNFYNTSSQLLEMYEGEYKLKKNIVENIAHVKDRNVMMFHTSCWLHQPYIEENSKLLLEAMLLETGHR